MATDARFCAARFYDSNPGMPQDLPFYTARIRSRTQSILELGCGTGRVLLPLSGVCGFIQGIDLSEAMISLCREKLAQAGLPETRARADIADITSVKLGRRFDLIIAPFRVLQNLETEEQAKGLFEVIRSHLMPDGSGILNTFKPFGNREAIIEAWATPVEDVEWEVPYEGGTLSCSCLRRRIDTERMIIYPELIYRVRRGGELVHEARLPIAMRCYWPEQLEQLVEAEGFLVKRKWGGYQGQEYGQGPELVIEIGLDRRDVTPGAGSGSAGC
jgi:SAM-dependent methyltransferase